MQVTEDTSQLFCCAFDMCVVLASLDTQTFAFCNPQQNLTVLRKLAVFSM